VTRLRTVTGCRRGDVLGRLGCRRLARGSHCFIAFPHGILRLAADEGARPPDLSGSVGASIGDDPKLVYPFRCLDLRQCYNERFTMRVYFDYNATTPPAEEVTALVSRITHEVFGNASSVHHFGQQAKAVVDDARSAVAALVGADPSGIVFTGGGAESDNFAIRGPATVFEAIEPPHPTRRHLIASAIEHEAVLNTLKALARRGWRTTLLPVDQSGVLAPERLREAISDDTALVSVMHANNEIGTIQPVAALADIAHAHGALMHTDAVQAVGKIPVDVRALGVDLLSLAAHKFNGPKGVGALWIKRGTRLQPLLTGGKHERNRRAGTENVPAIAGLGAAATLAASKLAAEGARVSALRDRLENG